MSTYPVSVFHAGVSGIVEDFLFFIAYLPVRSSERVGKEGDYTYRYTVTTRITSSSDEIRSNASLTVRDKVTRECLRTTTFGDRGEPRRNRT